MRKKIGCLFRALFALPLLLIGLSLLYTIAAFLLTLIPVNPQYTPPDKGVRIFLVSNGVHTAICIPAGSGTPDKKTSWLDFLRIPDGNIAFLCFGWGDREFFVNTPSWADLTFSNAFKALFLPTDGAMLVTPLYGTPVTGKLVKELTIRNSELTVIEQYIRKSFVTDSAGRPLSIRTDREQDSRWGGRQLFYEAGGKYDLFFTCNNWTNRALQEAGLKTAFWAPFDRSVLWHFRR